MIGNYCLGYTMPKIYVQLSIGGALMVKVYVKIKNVYGKELIYPDCPVTEIFASIAKTKTLSQYDLVDIKKLGYEISIRPRLQVSELVKDNLITIGE